MKDILSRKEAARVAGVSQRTILRAIHSKQLEAVKIGDGKTSAYLINRLALENYKSNRTKKGWVRHG